MSVGVACAALALLVELGLDQVVAVAPWLIVAFAFGLIAAVLGGWLGGLIAAGLSIATQAFVIPAWVPASASLAGVGVPIDAGASLAALLVGLWIRGLLLRRVGSPASPGMPATGDDPAVGLPSRAGGARPAARTARGPSTGPGAGDREPATTAAPGEPGRAVAAPSPTAAAPDDPDAIADAVRDVGTARTPVQIADALARHAAALSGAAGAIAYVGQDGADGLVALGRSGPAAAAAPERIASRSPSGGASRSDAPGGGPGVATVPSIAPRPLDLRIARGASSHGILRLVSAADPVVAPGPALEIVLLVAADAFERAGLQAGRRAAEADAAGAVGRVALLTRLAAELVGGRTVDDVARTLVDLAVDDLAAGFAVLHVPDPAAGTFELVHARGYPAGLVAGERSIPAGARTPVTRAAEEHAVVEIVGEDGWRAAFPSRSNVPAITGARAITAVPMGAGEAVHGVLTIGWRSTTDRNRVDHGVLAAAADQGAQALERALLHAQDEDARRFQEAFIGVVSHELRTPITTILAGSRLLRRRLEDDPRAAELSDDIEIEADRLSRIVDDLLVLSRLERRHLTIADEPVHLDHLLARIVRSESARWPDHRIVVRPSDRRHVVIGDETYVEQILRNLVSNAAKYSPVGSLVEVTVEDAPGGDVHVQVLDRGPGVAPSEVEELFSLFYRSPTTAASAAGAGIGLFVSRRLATEMGGRMWARPRPDGGSEFGFSLGTYPTDEGDLDASADEVAVRVD